jgi:hypothetical protein
MPLTCYICSKFFESSKIYLVHLRLVHAKHYTGCAIDCGQDGCPRIFDDFRSLRMHLEVNLSNTCNVSRFEKNVCNDDVNDDEIDIGDTLANDSTEKFDKKPDISTLTASFMRFIGQLECKANIAQANIQVFMENMFGFAEDIANYCADKVDELLHDLNIDPQAAVVETYMKDIRDISNFSDSVSTNHKRLKYLTECASFVEPVEKVSGTRSGSQFVSSLGYHRASVVEDTMQYIPTEQLLGCVCAHQDMVHIMQNFSSSCQLRSGEVISHFFYTETYRKHSFLAKYPEAFALHFYVDGFEITNPLGSHTGIHKLESLYMVVQNFPGELQSKLSSIFLVTLWYAQDVKTYGYDKIFEPAVTSLRQLKSEFGATVNIAGQEILVTATLVFVSADNLGFNSLFGFSESFRT